jgi:hypothetical protein
VNRFSVSLPANARRSGPMTRVLTAQPETGMADSVIERLRDED